MEEKEREKERKSIWVDFFYDTTILDNCRIEKENQLNRER